MAMRVDEAMRRAGSTVDEQGRLFDECGEQLAERVDVEELARFFGLAATA